MDCSPSGSSVLGILQQEYWNGLPCPLPGDLPDPGIECKCLMPPALACGFFTTAHLGSSLREKELINDKVQTVKFKGNEESRALWAELAAVRTVYGSSGSESISALLS